MMVVEITVASGGSGDRCKYSTRSNCTLAGSDDETRVVEFEFMIMILMMLLVAVVAGLVVDIEGENAAILY